MLAYNLTRVMNIVGIKPLIAAIGRLRRAQLSRLRVLKAVQDA